MGEEKVPLSAPINNFARYQVANKHDSNDSNCVRCFQLDYLCCVHRILTNFICSSEIPHTRIELKAVAVENTRTLDSFHCFEESTGKQLDVLTQVFSTVQSSLDAKNIVTRWAEAESSNKKSPTAAPVQVQTSLLDMTSCDKACACNCHKTRRLMVPCWLQAIMGFLLIGYSGLKLSGNSCNEKICRQQQKSILTLNYYFPRWFVYQRLINFRNYWSPIEGNIMSIRTPRIIERSTTTVFDMACQGNLEGLKRLFIQGLASPFDVNGSGKCDSVLFVCSRYHSPFKMVSSGAPF